MGYYEHDECWDYDNYDYNKPIKRKSYNPYYDCPSEEEIAELMYQDYLLTIQIEEMMMADMMYEQYLAELKESKSA